MQVKVFDLQQRRLHKTLRNTHSSAVACAAYVPSLRRGNGVATGGLDCTVATWDVSSGGSVLAPWQLRQDVEAAETQLGVANPPMAHAMVAWRNGHNDADDMCVVLWFMLRKLCVSCPRAIISLIDLCSPCFQCLCELFSAVIWHRSSTKANNKACVCYAARRAVAG